MSPRNTIVMAGLGIALVASGAYAGSFTTTAGNTPQTDENIQFNDAGLIDNALIVTGASNVTGFIVNFESDVILTTPAAGQARIEAQTGTFDNLKIYLDAPNAYKTIIFNILTSSDGDVKFTIVDEANVAHVQNFVGGLDSSGNNFYTTVSNSGFIKSFLIESSVGINYLGMDDVRAVRIGGVQVIPLPSAALSGALLLSGLAFHRRRTLAS